ncbi:serine/threonine-protein kinase [Streptomyces sedi]|uniref:non-specific serine/threonine protein kinase n=1 Tax=Streptomyces sedi TaxID=555059 RepID=A0A5C4V6Q9_9ACTN|nr:serine/threonine-protein kinase [Streptomyces sedi]TNM31632.1 serine/threonine protein kinase [Streptomyces sedi]
MERVGELVAGRYELVERLGRGGMGEVWTARDRALHREVALKLLHLDESVSPDLPRRFAREAVAAARINHPHVVALHDQGVHGDTRFLVMEKVEGTTLTGHLRAGVPVARALEIAEEICAALTAAHEAHVIHYDIKPHNVMLTPEGRVKVVDFGIAGFLQAVTSVAGSSLLSPAGTPEYGAPEQFLTERGDARSDLYALGGVLFALLSGRPPFTGHHPLAIVQRKLHEDAPRLDTLRPELPPAVTALVAALLDRDPDRRPQTARQVRERLGRLRAGLDGGREETGVAGRETVDGGSFSTRPLDDRLDEGRRPNGSAETFELSWTGREPLSHYTDTRTLRAWTWGLVVAAVLGALGTWFVASAGQVEPRQGEENEGWLTLFVVSSVTFVMAPPTLLAFRLFHRLTHRKPAWALRVGPQGIETTSDYEERAYGWHEFRRTVVKEIDYEEPLYRYTGLHVEFVKDAASPTASRRPAGWPPRLKEVGTGAHRLVPVCVLGPMTHRQRAELNAALARHSRLA